MAKNYTLTASMREAFKTNFSVRSHNLIADEPLETGGQDAGPLPFELPMAALAGCTTFTLRAYANHKKISLDGVDVEISLSRRDPNEVPQGDKTVVIKKKLASSATKCQPTCAPSCLKSRKTRPVNKALLEGCEISGELG